MGEVQALTLSSGHTMPTLAYGMGTRWSKSNESELDQDLVDATTEAINLGYRLLDGAQWYKNEPELGAAIKASGLARKDFFVTTKAFTPFDVEATLRKSLEKLGTDYVDLYLIHDPFKAKGDDSVLQDAWKGMEDCLNKGLARSIGISNFAIPHVEAILKVATVKPAVNQIELHPYLQRTELREYLGKQGIAVQAYGPLTPFTKAGPGPVDAVAERLAKKHNVSTSSVLLRWLIEQGVAVVTTSGQKKRLQEYLEQVPAFKLSEDEVKEISKAGSEKNFRAFFVDKFGKDSFI